MIAKGDIVSIRNSVHNEVLEVRLVHNRVAHIYTMALLGGKQYKTEVCIDNLKIIRKVKVLLPKQRTFSFMIEEDRKLDERVEDLIQAEVDAYDKLHKPPPRFKTQAPTMSTEQIAQVVASMVKTGKSQEEIKAVVQELY
jgi:hypothetical protein